MKQVQRITSWPQKFHEAINEYCRQNGEGVNDTITSLVRGAVGLLPNDPKFKVLKDALDSFEKVKHGRPSKETEGKWQLRKDIAECLAAGITTPYQIYLKVNGVERVEKGRKLPITYDMVVGQLRRHRSEIDEEVAKLQKKQVASAEHKARIERIKYLRGRQAAGGITREEIAELQALYDAMDAAAQAKASA
jgi:hypothetical protein